MAINWAQTPLAQGRQRELLEAQQFLQDVLGGRVNTGGLTAEQWGELIGLIGNVQKQYPGIDISQAMQTYVNPVMGGNLPTSLRNRALSTIASRAVQTRQWDPMLAQFLSGGAGSVSDIMAQGSLLSTLAPEFYQRPEWQSNYRRFLQTYAPGGSVVGAGAPIWAAVAQPYFNLQQINPSAAAQFGEVTFPTSAANMSKYARDVLSGIAEQGMATQGLTMGPAGPVKETPLERLQRLFSEDLQVLSNFVAPAQALGGGRLDEMIANYRKRALGEALTGGSTGGGGGPRISPETGQETLRQNAFEALKQRVGMYRTAKDALASLTRNAVELKAALGDKLYNDLLGYVRSLPPDAPGSAWAPTGTGEPVEDPFMAWIRKWRQ